MRRVKMKSLAHLTLFFSFSNFCTFHRVASAQEEYKIAFRLAAALCSSYGSFSDEGIISDKVSRLHGATRIAKHSCFVWKPKTPYSQRKTLVIEGCEKPMWTDTTGLAEFNTSSQKCQINSREMKTAISNEEINEIVAEARDMINNHIIATFQDVPSFSEFKQKLQKALRILDGLYDLATDYVDSYKPFPSTIAAELGRIFSELNIRNFSPCLRIIAYAGVTLNESEWIPSKWVSPLNTTKAYMKELEDYHDMLLSFELILTDMEVQLVRDLYNVKDLNDWGTPNRPQGIAINEQHFYTFLDKMRDTFNYSITNNFKTLAGSVHWGEMLTQLNSVLKRTLDYSIQCIQRTSSVTFISPYILVSEVLKSPCLTKRFEKVNIYALFKIMLDADINSKELGRSQDVILCIISPKWAVGVGGVHKIAVFEELYPKPPINPPVPSKTFPGLLMGNLIAIGITNFTEIVVTNDDKVVDPGAVKNLPSPTYNKTDVAAHIVRFKNELLAVYDLSTDKSTQWAMLLFDESDDVLDIYDPPTLLSELHMISSNLRKGNVTESLFKNYMDTLISRVKKLALMVKGTKKDEYKALAHIFVAANTAVLSCDMSKSNFLAIDLTEFFTSQDNLLSGMLTLPAEELKHLLVQNSTKECDNVLLERIAQSNELVGTILHPMVTDSVTTESTMISTTLSDIVQELHSGNDASKLNQLRRNLKSYCFDYYSSLLWVNMVSLQSFLSVSAISVQIIVKHLSSHVSFGETNPPSVVVFPADVTALNDRTAKLIRQEAEQQIQSFKDRLDQSLKEFKQCTSGCSMSISSLNEAARKIDEIVFPNPNTDTTGSNSFIGLIQAFKDQFTVQRLIAELEMQILIAFHDEFRSVSDNETWKGSGGMGSFFGGLLGVAKTVEQQLFEIYNSVKALNHETFLFFWLKKRFAAEAISLTTKMLIDVKSALADPANASAPTLDVSLWDIPSLILMARLAIAKAFLQADTTRTVDSTNKLQDIDLAFVSIIEMYDRVEYFRRQQAQEASISILASPDIKSVKPDNMNISNVISNTEIVILGNLVRERYNHYYNLLRVWVFYFAELLVEQHKMNPFNSVGNQTSVYNLTGQLRAEIGRLNTTLQHYKDDKIPGIELSDAATGAFKGVWTLNRINISRAVGAFLDGEKIYFRLVDNDDDWRKQVSVKFDDLNLFLISKNGDKEVDRRIKEALEDYYLHMTINHATQYDFFGKNVYSFPIGKIHMMRSYVRKGDFPKEANDIYWKFRKEGYRLSPFGFWEMQLEPVKGNKSNFGSLIKYKDKVKFFLFGMGRWWPDLSDRLPKINMYYENDIIWSY